MSSLLSSTPSLGVNGSRVLTPPLVVHHYQGCVDLHGQAIPHGLLFAPGPDECQICTCVNGAAALCRTVLCAPPTNCRSLRVGDQCCQWICLDDIHPHGGDHFDGGDGDPDGGSADVKLRLVASALTAILSIALLFFLIYRLRQRTLQNRFERRRRHDRDLAATASSSFGLFPDQISSTSFPMAMLGSGPPPPPAPPQQHHHWYSLAWWKPANCNDNVFRHRPAPPSYDDAMMHHPGRDAQPQEEEDAVGECSSVGSTENSSEAPPYSEIHLDPVIQEGVSQEEWQRREEATSSAGHPRNTIPISSHGPSASRAPCGAALVLPPGPAPDQSLLHHVSSSSTLPPHPDQLVLRRLRARSREGIVLPPLSSCPTGREEERDADAAALHRFSLELQMDASQAELSFSSSSNPEEDCHSRVPDVDSPSTSNSSAERV